MMFKALAALSFVLTVAVLCVAARGPLAKGCGKSDQESGGRGRCQHEPKYTLRFSEMPRNQVPRPGHASLKNRSISPWIYKNNYDPDRYPATIAEAHCIHPHCINARGELDEDLNTQTVWQQMLVLRREHGGNKLNFLVEEIMVPIACVCVRARVLQA